MDVQALDKSTCSVSSLTNNVVYECTLAKQRNATLKAVVLNNFDRILSNQYNLNILNVCDNAIAKHTRILECNILQFIVT